MAHAQYETRTRTVEEVVVVLTLTEDEADELHTVVGAADGTRAMVRILRALEKPGAPEVETWADTFEYSGVTYEYGALYRDIEDDFFEIRRVIDADDGTPVGRYRYLKPTADPGDWTWTLAEVVGSHGPLTKVTA
ncbi:phiSA1p31-related protein [Streptomyces sp. NPDC057557]|uniref:phiSA1p31-related protein n=1 Tax=Streptomyces sp. NPDC057557 TaxID=3346167 RepID=UPI003682CA6F